MPLQRATSRHVLYSAFLNTDHWLDDGAISLHLSRTLESQRDNGC